MTDEPTARGADNANAPLPKWAGLAIVVLTAVVVVLLLLLATSIMHRRWEAQRPALVAADIDEFESDNAVWGKNYEREYDAYKRQEASTVKTRYGGPFPRDYLDGDPNQVIIFAGYGFSKDYLQARGHIWAVEDISKTKRVKKPKKEGEKVFYPGTCWTCKSPDVPRKMAEFGRKQDPKETDPIKLIGLGAADFYASNWHDLKKDIKHPIGCLDCHDPKTMALRISRPALREGYQAVTGRSIETATHQEMRSLVCAQCHVEYYFKGKGKYLTFPWQKGDTFAKGTSVEKMIEYYDAPNFVDTRADDPDNAPLVDFVDFVHPISKTRIIKCQHPDYEMFATGQWSHYGIAKHLNTRGIRMTNRYDERKPFDQQNIRIFLHSHWLYRGWIVPNGRNGEYTFQHDETDPPLGAVRGQFPALVSEKLAVDVTKALRVRQTMAPQPRQNHVYLLTPILHCANCGETLRGKPTREAYYYAHPKKTCRRGYGNIPCEALEKHIIDLLRGFRVPDDWRAALEQKLQERLDAMQTPHQQQSAIDVDKLHRSLERLRDVYVYGDISREDYEQQRDALRQQIASLETQQVQPPYDINELLNRLETIGAHIAAADPERQKQFISALFTRLETEKNDAGEWIISSAVVRSILADFFQDLRKVRQSPSSRELGSLSQQRGTRRRFASSR